ncbi:MAG: ATP-dependent helicase [Lachnospiraceae bacterium]|nr:ATP-dependent helicase [Lachnospiraceae bacterium]
MEFNEAQNAALSHRTGPMMVLAGPGSGKTTVITHRIKRLLEQGVSPSGILVITFTKAAAGEMEERFLSLLEREGEKLPSGKRVSFGTFHSVFYRILRLAYRFPAGNVVSEEEKRTFLKRFLAESGLEVEDEGEFLASIMNEISYVKGNRLELSCYYSQNCPEEWFKRLYEGYENELARTGKIDFDDMLTMCFALFKERKDILAAWQRKFSYILVDEFQDINSLQYEIVKMLALPENNLFIVGDDDQSIYRFRGAKPELMLGFEKDYPTAKRVLLGINYRSTREVVAASLRLIAHNRVRFSKELLPAHGSGRPVDFVLCANPPAQMERVARLLREYQRAGYEWEQMAVLFRTGTSSGLLAEKLMEYNVPFVLRDVIPGLYSHWIAKDIFSYLALGAGRRRRSDFFRIMNRPNRYLSRDAFDTSEVSLDAVRGYYRDKDWMEERLTDLEADLRTIGRLKPYAAIQYIRQTVGYDRYLKEYAEFRRMDVEELFDILWQLSESAAAFSTAAEWAVHVNRYQEEIACQKEQERTGVTLSTMHSAKGLEYAVVFLIDANEGVVPHHKAVLPADLEEERRLFYVAMTRAKERLHLLAVRERRRRPQEVSRFVGECMGT